MRWVGVKKIPSYRQLLSISRTGASGVVVQAPVPALSKPDFRDPANPRAPVGLVVAVEVWEEISGSDYIDGISPNPKQVAKSAIERHATGKNLSTAAKGRVATLVNWSPDGGCPKTPGN